MSRELLQRALDVLDEYPRSNEWNDKLDSLLYEIGDYLEKPLPEPIPGVAMRDGLPVLVKIGAENDYDGRLYTSAPEQNPLSDDEIIDMYFDGFSIGELLGFARAIERAHGIADTVQSKPQSNAI